MPNYYDPLEVSPNSAIGFYPNSNMNPGMNSNPSNIKRAVSDNVQFYSQSHFTQNNTNNGGLYNPLIKN